MSPLWVVVAGVVVGAVVVVRDRRSRRARVEAVARASHELRGPLQAAMLGLAAVARPEVAPDPATRTRLVALERELRRATLALTDLDAAHGRSRAPEQVEAVEVAALLSAQVEAWAATAQRRGRTLRHVPAGPVIVRADPRRIAQATGNLIANALEHGDGAVTVRAEQHGQGVRIEVADEGPGLPAPVQQILSRRRTRRPRGRGLVVAADVAARHGGRLTTVPAAHGCRIVLELPHAIARAA